MLAEWATIILYFLGCVLSYISAMESHSSRYARIYRKRMLVLPILFWPIFVLMYLCLTSGMEIHRRFKRKL